MIENQRPGDKTGLVVFAGKEHTQGAPGYV